MNTIIEIEAFGCMVGMLYIMIIFFAVITLWYTFTFIMWIIYRHNKGKHGYFSYLRIKELKL